MGKDQRINQHRWYCRKNCLGMVEGSHSWNDHETLRSWQESPRQMAEFQPWTFEEQILTCSGTCLAGCRWEVPWRAKGPRRAGWSRMASRSTGIDCCLVQRVEQAWQKAIMDEHGDPNWVWAPKETEAGTGYLGGYGDIAWLYRDGVRKPRLIWNWS